MSRGLAKILVFVVLLVVLFAVEGFVPPPGAFTRQGPPWLPFTAAYIYGAILTLWGDKTVGILHPISYRWLCISGGTLLMLVILSLAIYVRGRSHA
jgi:hypothetical protein